MCRLADGVDNGASLRDIRTATETFRRIHPRVIGATMSSPEDVRHELRKLRRSLRGFYSEASGFYHDNCKYTILLVVVVVLGFILGTVIG